MTRFLRSLFGQTTSPRRLSGSPTPTATRFRPRVESLDERVVLSTASASVHAVTEGFDHPAAFYINRQDGAFYENDYYHGTRELSGPGTVQTFSAGLDRNGYADVFVKDGAGALWEWKDWGQGWQRLLGPDAHVGSFAAVDVERVYVVMGGTDTVWRWSPELVSTDSSGNQHVVDPGGFTFVLNFVKSIDAVSLYAPNSAYDAVFTLNDDASFGEFYLGHYAQLSGPGTVQSGFSAGVDAQGGPDVYVLAGDGQFWEHNSYQGWKWLDGAAQVRAISASAREVVYVIAADSTLVKYDTNPYRHTGTLKTSVYSGCTFTEISSAFDIWSSPDNDTVYTSVGHSSGWERRGDGQWFQFAASGAVN
jgi:hypothetical protein